jgi:outer membrane protein OmpA-like peptidoglycan-associated protein
MNKMMQIAIVSTLSLQSPWAGAATSAPPVTSADVIAAQIETSGRAEPLVEFVRGTALLTPASTRQLVELVRLLKEDPLLRIEIGLAPTSGTQLAEERVRALRDALLDLAAPADRLAIRAAS